MNPTSRLRNAARPPSSGAVGSTPFNQTAWARTIELVQARGTQAILTGTQIPPNYGPAYTEAFQGIYPGLTREYGIALVAFLMDGVALDSELMQPDGIYPDAAGHHAMFENRVGRHGPGARRA